MIDINKPVKTVLTCGTFDLFHVGHLLFLKRCKSMGNKLVVGVSSDALNYKKKGRVPILSTNERLLYLETLGIADEVFVEEYLQEKANYCKTFSADCYVSGDDWKGQFDEELAGVCQVVYIPRYSKLSTTDIINRILSKSKTT